MSDLNDLRERYRRSLEAFIRGDPEPRKQLWSRHDDITLANPLGPPAKGYDRVCAVMDNAAALIREGEGLRLETISFSRRPISRTKLTSNAGGCDSGTRPRWPPLPSA